MLRMKATKRHPYPYNFEEFLSWFATEEDCWDYLEWLRWGEQFTCPKCGCHAAWPLKARHMRQCKKCGRQTSATAGTVFADGRKPLRFWFHVIWMLMAQKTGMSAENFHEAFGFGSYQTSWGWLQKLRSVMVRPGRDKLCGRVEVDETFVGGQKEGARGRGAQGKTLVLVAVEGEKKQKLGRVRFRVVQKASRDAVRNFVADYIEKGSTIVTDGFYPYVVVEGDFQHEKYVQNPSRNGKVIKDKSQESNLEHVHLVISLLKRWLAGTLQGSVTPNHLTGYLDEFAFRFNRRKSTYRGLLFFRLVSQALTTRPLGIKDFYKSKIKM